MEIELLILLIFLAVIFIGLISAAADYVRLLEEIQEEEQILGRAIKKNKKNAKHH